jgi:hypothetical protein
MNKLRKKIPYCNFIEIKLTKEIKDLFNEKYKQLNREIKDTQKMERSPMLMDR